MGIPQGGIYQGGGIPRVAYTRVEVYPRWCIARVPWWVYYLGGV